MKVILKKAKEYVKDAFNDRAAIKAAAYYWKQALDEHKLWLLNDYVTLSLNVETSIVENKIEWKDVIRF